MDRSNEFHCHANILLNKRILSLYTYGNYNAVTCCAVTMMIYKFGKYDIIIQMVTVPILMAAKSRTRIMCQTDNQVVFILSLLAFLRMGDA